MSTSLGNTAVLWWTLVISMMTPIIAVLRAEETSWINFRNLSVQKCVNCLSLQVFPFSFSSSFSLSRMGLFILNTQANKQNLIEYLTQPVLTNSDIQEMKSTNFSNRCATTLTEALSFPPTTFLCFNIKTLNMKFSQMNYPRDICGYRHHPLQRISMKTE